MKKSMNSRRPDFRRPHTNAIWLFLGPRSGWSGSMSLSRSAAYFVLNSSTVIVPVWTARASVAIVVMSAGSRTAHRSWSPGTTRVSSPGTLEKSVPPSEISRIASANGVRTPPVDPPAAPPREAEVREGVERRVGLPLNLDRLAVDDLDLDPAARVAPEARRVDVPLRTHDRVRRRGGPRGPLHRAEDHGAIAESERCERARGRGPLQEVPAAQAHAVAS